MRPFKAIGLLLCFTSSIYADASLDAYVRAQSGVSGATFKVSKVEQVSGDSWLVIVSPSAKDELMGFRERDPEAEYDLVRELFGKFVLLGECRFDGVSGGYAKFRYERATKYEGTVDADTVRLVGISRNAEAAQSTQKAVPETKPTQEVVKNPEPEADSPNERSGKAGELAVVAGELRKLESALAEVERFLRSPPEGAQLADLARQLELKEGLQKRIEAACETRSRVEVELRAERKQAFHADYAAYAKIPDGSEYAAAKRLGWRELTGKWQVVGGTEPGRLVWDDTEGLAVLSKAGGPSRGDDFELSLGRETVRVTLEKITGPERGRDWTVDLGGSERVQLKWIAPGSFQMGSNDGDSDEKPVHRVTLSQGYWLGSTEVTQGQWQSVMGSNPSHFKGGNLPVEKVSWEDAMSFCRKLTERERAAGRLSGDLAYTLPTEAQWEYACRAGTTGAYAGDLDAMAWYAKNSGRKTHPVGTKRANAWGLYDMHGNVWEWCSDWYGDYPRGSVTDPTGANSGSLRVLRGGSWGVTARYCRSADRFRDSPGYAWNLLGFRLALSSI